MSTGRPLPRRTLLKAGCTLLALGLKQKTAWAAGEADDEEASADRIISLRTAPPGALQAAQEQRFIDPRTLQHPRALQVPRTLTSVMGRVPTGTGLPGMPPVMTPATPFAPPVLGEEGRSLALYNVHTLETLRVDFRDGNGYRRDALILLDQFLRDWRSGAVTSIDHGVIEALAELQYFAEGRKVFVLSAYRTPETNAMLASLSSGVARNSLHMYGRAVDIFIPGVDLDRLRERALTLRAGGVGYYPRRGFIHVDTGRVRSWEIV